MGLFTGIFWNFQTQHKKSSFPSSICSVNVAVTKEILYGKLHCLCCEKNICLEKLWKIASLTCKLFIKAFAHNFFLGQFIWSVNDILCDDPEILGKNYNIERNKARVSKRGQREKCSLILWLPWQNSYIQRSIHDSGKHLEWRALQQ